ncbi:MAG: aldo/keto reductase [Microbacterium sp.]
MARGFLTGKYRDGVTVTGPRAQTGYAYLATDRGRRVLAVLDEVATAHRTSPGAVSLAWLLAKPTVAAPISSARVPDQLGVISDAVRLELTADEIDLLDDASGR